MKGKKVRPLLKMAVVVAVVLAAFWIFVWLMAYLIACGEIGRAHV